MWPDDNPCRECVIVHNNWMVGGDAKVYRFKEHGQWLVDKDGYYSSHDRKYLVYDNPLTFADYGKVHVQNLATLYFREFTCF